MLEFLAGYEQLGIYSAATMDALLRYEKVEQVPFNFTAQAKLSSYASYH